MLDLANDIRSLSDFKRNTTDLLDRLRKTGHPLVLTINGKAKLVVQTRRRTKHCRPRRGRRGDSALRPGRCDGGSHEAVAPSLRSSSRKHGIPR